MTREAKHYMEPYDQITKLNYDVQIDTIYDEFESRICKNCTLVI